MRYLVMFVMFAFGLTIGFFGADLYSRDVNSDREPDEIRLNNNFNFVNPLLECEQGSDYLSKNSIKPFRPVVQKAIDKAISSGKAEYVSVYFRDLNNGMWFGINERENFFPASLMKLPILMYFLKVAETDPDILEEEVEYVSGHEPSNQFFKTKDPVEVGKTYTIKELLEHTIIHSDNNAALLLYQITDKAKFEKIFSEFGIENPKEFWIDYVNVKSYSTFFRVLFNASYISHAYSESALELLSQVDFNSGLTAKLPKSVVVSHKFGESQNDQTGKKQLHDCGIVYYPEKPYLICVMTRGTDFNNLASVIADISKESYDEVGRQLK